MTSVTDSTDSCYFSTRGNCGVQGDCVGPSVINPDFDSNSHACTIVMLHNASLDVVSFRLSGGYDERFFIESTSIRADDPFPTTVNSGTTLRWVSHYWLGSEWQLCFYPYSHSTWFTTTATPTASTTTSFKGA